ncbi:MAG: phage major tail tube protein [Burkholderia gladioli]
MAGIQINRITNANIYVNGNCLLGTAEEVTLPDISVKETEHKALGMVGSIFLPSGFDKLEGKIKWNSFYFDVWSAFANPFVPVMLQCYCSVDTYASQGRINQARMLTTVTATMKKLPLGTFKQHENAEFQSDFTATYVKQQLGGRDVIELDTMANVFKVNGVDQLELYKSNIGG